MYAVSPKQGECVCCVDKAGTMCMICRRNWESVYAVSIKLERCLFDEATGNSYRRLPNSASRDLVDIAREITANKDVVSCYKISKDRMADIHINVNKGP